MELTDSTVLVTGATGNLGPYVIDGLLAAGATVIGTVRTEADRPDDEGRADGSDALAYYQVDLTDGAATDALAGTVADEHGPVDHIVGLAGGFSMGGVADTDADAFEAALARHATTAFLTVRAFADQLDARGGVVLFSSERAIHPVAGSIGYNVAKGAVRSLTGSLDVELDARVNAIAPYLVDVAGNREAMPDADFAEWTAPEAVVDEIEHLLTNEGVRGQVIRMTGGQLEVAA